VLLCSQDGGRGGGVRAARIKHYGNADRSEKRLADFLDDRLPQRDVGAANKNGGAGEVLSAAGEHGAVDEALDVIHRDSRVTEEDVHAGIDSRDRVKDAGLWIRI
jgi:hypothetical protein